MRFAALLVMLTPALAVAQPAQPAPLPPAPAQPVPLPPQPAPPAQPAPLPPQPATPAEPAPSVTTTTTAAPAEPASFAPPQAVAVPNFGHQRAVGIFGEVGVFNGFGVGGRLNAGSFGVRASLDWNPAIVAIRGPGPTETTIDAKSSVQISADVIALFIKGTERASIGPLGGYRHNTILGNGVALGGYAIVDLGPHLAFEILGGAIWYPDGNERARVEFGLQSGQEFGFPGAGLNWGANVSLIAFP